MIQILIVIIAGIITLKKVEEVEDLKVELVLKEAENRNLKKVMAQEGLIPKEYVK